MAKEWVDFKMVKEAVGMPMVLDHYGIKNLTKSGDELRGVCPIHKGSERSKNFTVNTRKNAFRCFSKNCGAHGNVLDFVAAMERCDVRDAALKLQVWFKIRESQASSEQSEEQIPAAEVCRGIYQDESGELYEVIAPAAMQEGPQELVVYRELFGEFHFWVAPSAMFDQEYQTALNYKRRC